MLLGYIVASVVSNTAWSFIHGVKANKNKRPGDVRHFRADVWAYALPLIPMELIFWVSGLGDRYVIGYLMTASDVGLYAATYLIINEAFNRSAMVLLETLSTGLFSGMFTKPDQGRIQDLVVMDRVCFLQLESSVCWLLLMTRNGWPLGGARKFLSSGG